jgi:hypothetical protein
MIDKKIDIPCKCGHAFNVHKLGVSGLSTYMCMVAGPQTTVTDCPCYKYMPDNLLYIEQLAKQKGLV